jgi:hypothetical protein
MSAALNSPCLPTSLIRAELATAVRYAGARLAAFESEALCGAAELDPLILSCQNAS